MPCALNSLPVAAQLILLQHDGLLFTIHKGLFPRPREMLTDEPHTHKHSRPYTQAHTQPSVTDAATRKQKNTPPSSASFDWSQAKHFFLPLPLRCCFSSHPSAPPPLHPTLSFFFFPRFGNECHHLSPFSLRRNSPPGQTSAEAPNSVYLNI